MSQRGTHLHVTADGQLAELIDLVSRLGAATLRLPCPGREKLGDGTIAAAVGHTAGNYQRIAEFVQISNGMTASHAPIAHGNQHTANGVDPRAVLEQLSGTRDTLARIAELTDDQLDAIPPKDSFRFCDGQRTLEQVLASLLKHQRHQLDALTTAARGAT